MTVEQTPEMESIVSERLSSGQYPSAQAVLEEAFSALQVQEAHCNSPTPPTRAHSVAYPVLSAAEREERARRMEELFARIDAEGPYEDLEIDRHAQPPDKREPWLS